MRLTLTKTEKEIRRSFRDLEQAGDVASILEVTWPYLDWLLYSKPIVYTTFTIPKRTGGLRQIDVPPKSIAILQSKLAYILSLVYRPKDCVHGFRTERSIVTNAQAHCGKKHVLNVDIKDFFPSINFGRVRGMLMAKPHHVGRAAATVLAQLVCLNRKLPQGAATSPIVSNMLAARFDSNVQNVAKKYHCYYTRYADDLTFSYSGRVFPRALAYRTEDGRTEVGGDLSEVFESNSFALNTKKSRLQSEGERQMVTGLIVNRFPNVTRGRIRQLRAIVHAIDRFGMEAAARDHFKKISMSPDDITAAFKQRVLGLFAYVSMVRGGEDLTYRRLVNRLSEVCPSWIEPLPEHGTPGNAAQHSRQWDHWKKHYARSVLHLELESSDSKLNSGSCFVVGKNVVATAAHNVKDRCATIIGPNEERITVKRVFFHDGVDMGCDIAILVAELPAQCRVKLPIRMDKPAVHEQIAAIGFPSIPMHQPAMSLLQGYVESHATNFLLRFPTIQVSFQASGGLSGGPVIDRGGSVVGLVMEGTFEKADEKPRLFSQVLPSQIIWEALSTYLSSR